MSLSIVQVACMTFALVFVRKSRSKTSKQMRLQDGIRVKAGEFPPPPPSLFFYESKLCLLICLSGPKDIRMALLEDSEDSFRMHLRKHDAEVLAMRQQQQQQQEVQ